MCPIAIFSPNSAKILRSISRYLQKVLQLPKYSYVLPIVTSFFRNKVSLICTQCNALPINAFLLIHWIHIYWFWQRQMLTSERVSHWTIRYIYWIFQTMYTCMVVRVYGKVPHSMASYMSPEPAIMHDMISRWFCVNDSTIYCTLISYNSYWYHYNPARSLKTK